MTAVQIWSVLLPRFPLTSGQQFKNKSSEDFREILWPRSLSIS